MSPGRHVADTRRRHQPRRPYDAVPGDRNVFGGQLAPGRQPHIRAHPRVPRGRTTGFKAGHRRTKGGVAAIAASLNPVIGGTGQPFNPRIILKLRQDHGIPSRHDRLRANGMLTLTEITQQLGVHHGQPATTRRSARDTRRAPAPGAPPDACAPAATATQAPAEPSAGAPRAGAPASAPTTSRTPDPCGSSQTAPLWNPSLLRPPIRTRQSTDRPVTLGRKVGPNQAVALGPSQPVVPSAKRCAPPSRALRSPMSPPSRG
jgi:hypothetical protein